MKVRFKYSWIYDQNWKLWIKLYPYHKPQGWLNPKQIEEYTKFIEDKWRSIEESILKEMKKATGLEWNEDVTCYIVGKCSPFSDPLTLPADRSEDEFMDLLIHELAHNLLMQHPEINNKEFTYLNNKFKNESEKTKLHILIQAIVKHVWKETFKDEKEEHLRNELKHLENFKAEDYVKAWNIINTQGYNKILKDFREAIS